MGYSYRLSGAITMTPPPEWAELKRSGFLEWGDRDIAIIPKATEADDGRRAVLAAEVEGSVNEPRCYHLEAELQAMVERFPGVTWSGYIEGMGEDGTDQFRLYVHQGMAKLARPEIVWPEGAR